MTNAAATPHWRRLLNTRLRDLIRGRVDGRLDWRELIAAATLPPEIEQLLGNVVRYTRLWRSEKVDVTRELIAHFQDGLSTGRLPQQLLATFGDPRIAAQLIRRAKTRGRPLPWRIARWCVTCVAALIGVYLTTGLYLLTGRPSIAVDYLSQINIRAQAVPESARAWTLYRRALFDLRTKDGDSASAASRLKDLQDARPGDEQWTSAEQILSDHAATIAQLQQAGRRESLGLPLWPTFASFSADDQALFRLELPLESKTSDSPFPDLKDRLLAVTLMPHVQLLRESAGVLVLDCRRAAHAGDADAALANVLAQLAGCRHLQETTFITIAKAADELRHRAMLSIHEVLSERARLWSDDQLRTLAHQIARTEIDWERAFAGERAIFDDMVQRLYTDDGHGDGRLVPGAIQMLQEALALRSSGSDLEWIGDTASFMLLPAVNVIVASRGEMIRFYDRYFETVSRRLTVPFWEWNNRQDRAARNELDELENESVRGMGLRYFLVRSFRPGGESFPTTVEYHRGIRDGVLIGIALELFHRESGAWPQTLDELAPRWLPALPVDRVTGYPLRYRIVDGRPLVYSVGVDRSDDRGRVPTGAEPDPRGRYLGEPWGRRSAEPENVPEYDGDWIIWSTVPKSLGN